MNKIIFLLIIFFSLNSCKKDSSKNDENPGQTVAGVYTSTTGTETIVSSGTNGTISLKYIPCCSNPYYLFEKVKLSNDMTFTINETIQEPTNLSGSIREPEQYIGTGYFKNNIIHYDVKSVRGVNRILFDGVR